MAVTDRAARDGPRSQRPGLPGALRRLRLFPLHTVSVRLGIAQRLHARRSAVARRWIDAGKLAVLEQRTSVEAMGAGAMGQDPADLRYLYDTVMRGRPERSIEFGSGQSTLFIAQALHDVGRGHLWSLDADARWLDHTESILPDHLRPFVTLVHSPVAATRDYGMTTWRYSAVPSGPWDFVLIDGPAGADGITASCDLIDLIPHLTPHAAGFIDHRWRTAVLAREQCGRSLRFRYIPSLESFAFRRR